MHLEILVEDASGACLLERLMPRILGNEHTWRIHPYKGIGHLPPGMKPKSDARRRILLDQLPRLLAGYGKTPGIDAVVVVVDADTHDCREFLTQLQAVLAKCPSPPRRTLFRLAIEEIESWYLGDREALRRAFPRIHDEKLSHYQQDSVCGTWEYLVDALYSREEARRFRNADFATVGELKRKWAIAIGPHMDPERNVSPSFGKLRDGLRRLVQETPSETGNGRRQ